MNNHQHKLSDNNLLKATLLFVLMLLPLTNATASEQYISFSRSFINVNMEADGSLPVEENYLRYVFATAGSGYSAIYGYNFKTVTEGFGIEIGYQLNETEKRTRTFAEGDRAPYDILGDDSNTGTTQVKYTRLYADVRYYQPIFKSSSTPAALHIGVGLTQTTSDFILNNRIVHNEQYTSIGNFVLGVRIKFRDNAFLYIDYQSFFPYLIAENFPLATGSQFTVEASSNTIGVSFLFGSKQVKSEKAKPKKAK